jgi:hypothetical protein
MTDTNDSISVAMPMTFVVRPEVACAEWSKAAPGLVSRAVSNPSLRHW